LPIAQNYFRFSQAQQRTPVHIGAQIATGHTACRNIFCGLAKESLAIFFAKHGARIIMTDRCPHCGQIRRLRYGAQLGPIATRIVDAIERAGADGISPSDLFDLIYADRPGRGRSALSGYISVINYQWKDEAPVRIACVDGCYVLQRRPTGKRRRAA